MTKTKKNSLKKEKALPSSEEIILEEGEITQDIEVAQEEKKGLDQKIDLFKSKQAEAQAVEDADKALLDENHIEPNMDTLSGGEKTLAAIGYISFFCILTLLLKPKSKFCQFHGKQGLVLVIVSLILSVFGRILGYIHYLFDFIFMLFVFGIAIYGIYLAIKGEQKKIPLIGQLAEKLEF